MPEYTTGDVSVAIPTLGRDQVLLETIAACLEEPSPPGEVLVIDQSASHTEDAAAALQRWHETGRIRWERRTTASQPAAMNHALRVASRPLLLFLDDDVQPARGFVAAHVAAQNATERCVVVGQIIQPWQEPADVAPGPSRSALTADFEFPFHSTQACWMQNAMSGHMSVGRSLAREVGGFDENFQGAAYRFDTEFARRVLRCGGRVRFWPAASLRHLRAERGGTRIFGGHLASADPIHGVGDYYFALLHGWNPTTAAYMARRMVREVATRFHLRHPWYIPVKLLGELRAFAWAVQLQRGGQRLLNGESECHDDGRSD